MQAAETTVRATLPWRAYLRLAIPITFLAGAVSFCFSLPPLPWRLDLILCMAFILAFGWFALHEMREIPRHLNIDPAAGAVTITYLARRTQTFSPDKACQILEWSDESAFLIEFRDPSFMMIFRPHEWPKDVADELMTQMREAQVEWAKPHHVDPGAK